MLKKSLTLLLSILTLVSSFTFTSCDTILNHLPDPLKSQLGLNNDDNSNSKLETSPTSTTVTEEEWIDFFHLNGINNFTINYEEKFGEHWSESFEENYDDPFEIGCADLTGCYKFAVTNTGVAFSKDIVQNGNSASFYEEYDNFEPNSFFAVSMWFGTYFYVDVLQEALEYTWNEDEFDEYLDNVVKDNEQLYYYFKYDHFKYNEDTKSYDLECFDEDNQLCYTLSLYFLGKKIQKIVVTDYVDDYSANLNFSDWNSTVITKK